MDHVFGGSGTIEGCKKQIHQVNKMFASGGLPLQKRTSNHPELLTDIQNAFSSTTALLIDNQDSHRTLGMNWDSIHDNFIYLPKVDQQNMKVAICSVSGSSVV